MNVGSRKPLRWLLYCIALGIVVVAFFIGMLWVKMLRDDSLARVQIQKRLEAIRAAGEPLSAQDLAKLYPDPPPEHDAVLLLSPALDELARPEHSKNLPFFSYPRAEWPKGTAPLDGPMLTEIQTWTDKNQKAFGKISLDQLKNSWIGCSFTNGFTNLVSAPASKIDSLTKLLCLNAVLHAELHHPKEAAQSLEMAAAVGNSWRNDLFVHGMLKLTAQNQICRTLNRMVNRTVLADPDLSLISGFLSSTNVRVTKEGVLVERCLLLSQSERLRALASQVEARPFSSPLRFLLNAYQARMIYRDQDLLNYLESAQECISTLDLPLSNSIPSIAKLKQDSEESEKRQHVGLLNTFKKRRISFLFPNEPQLAMSIESEAEIVARVRIAQTAIAVERWRLAHNDEFPDSLARVVPDFLPSVPIDPFDGQPLRFKRLAHGYVVYSIGADFVDDGGKEKPPEASEADNYDITFTVER